MKILYSLLFSLLFFFTGLAFSQDSMRETESLSNQSSMDVNVSWKAPEKLIDGGLLALGDIQGYEIVYREIGSDVLNHIQINGAENTSYSIKNIPIANYELAIATIKNNGVYSDFSSYQIVDFDGGVNVSSKPFAPSFISVIGKVNSEFGKQCDRVDINMTCVGFEDVSGD